MNAGLTPDMPFYALLGEMYEDEEVGHGAHWKLFYDDIKSLVSQLPDAAEQGIPVETRADDPHNISLPFPSDEPSAIMLSWPEPNGGMIQVFQTDSKGKLSAFVSAYPWTEDGALYLAQLQRIRLWPGRLEAHVEVVLGENVNVTFFDTLFSRNRIFYRKNGFYPFVFTGFAYAARVGANPDNGIASQSSHLTPTGTIADEYDFSGIVKSVATIRFLGRPVLLVRVNLGKLPEPFADDFDLNVILTDTALGFGREPEEGSRITGRLWLTGHLRTPNFNQ